MSDMLRRMQKAAGVPADRWVSLQESEQKEAVKQDVVCPFCGLKMSASEFHAHYMEHHHADVMKAMHGESAEEEAKEDNKEDAKSAEDAEKEVVARAEEEQAKKESVKFTKGQKVEYNGSHYLVEVPDAKDDFIGIVPLDKAGQEDAVMLVKGNQLNIVTEDVEQEEPIVEEVVVEKEVVEEKAETNTNYYLDKPIEWMEKKKPEDKVQVPGKVTSAIRGVLRDAEANIKKYEGRDDGKHQYFTDCQKVMKELLDYFSDATVADCKLAALYVAGVKSPINTEIPAVVWEWLMTGSKPSLKDYVNVVKGK